MSMRDGKELNGPWRMMYSMEVIKRCRLRFEETLRIREDTIFTNEYFAKCDTVRTLDILYYLHNNSNSVIDVYNRNTERMIDGKIMLIKAKKDLTVRVKTECMLDTSDLCGRVHSFFNSSWLDACEQYIYRI